MVRRCLFWGTVLAAGLLGTRDAPAGVIQFTGDVEKDFPVQVGTSLVVDFPYPSTSGSTSLPQSNPGDVVIPAWMSAAGRQTGLNIKDLRIHFDRASDTVYVGVNFFGIAGDVDGDGNPSAISTPSGGTVKGAVDQPNLGGRETIVVGFDLNNDKVTDIVAGTPTSKSAGQDGMSSFKVAKALNNGLTLGYAFGDSLDANNGGLYAIPDASKPDYEFTITNFSKLPGFNPLSDSFGVTAYAASLDAIIVGEDMVQYTAVSPQVITPEPATLLAWSLATVGGLTWGAARRRRRESPGADV
jgi:hypothetical protein